MKGPVVALRDQVAGNQLEAALRSMTDLVRRLVRDRGLAGDSFPLPQLDGLCADIAAVSAYDLFSPPQALTAEAHDLVLVTEVSVHGGHLEIVRDIAAWSERKLVIVATNLDAAQTAVLPALSAHPRVLDCVILDDAALLARLRALQTLVANPAARRVLVLCHAHDAVAIAGVAGVDSKTVLFFHHCDHSPCLGCYLPHAHHVDLHNLGFEHCRTHLGIASRYVCLTSSQGHTRSPTARPGDPMFKSATCGSEHKLVSLRYPIGYSDVVIRLLSRRGGVHFHIGWLSEDFIATIRQALRAARLPEDAFVPVGHVSGLRDILAALEVDLYLPTLPQSGGKALVEAMAAGVPILVHENALGRLWGGRDLVYPEAPSWSSLDELDDRLQRFAEAAYWQAQATASRAYFDAYHGTVQFARMLRADGDLAAAAIPALKPYRPDLDERLRACAQPAEAGAAA